MSEQEQQIDLNPHLPHEDTGHIVNAQVLTIDSISAIFKDAVGCVKEHIDDV